MAKIALFGAAGAIGRSLVDALNQRGESYRVVGRDPVRLRKTFDDPAAEIVAWNPDDPSSVREAARGVDTLIYLVGVPYNHFELHPQVMRKTLDGAIAENVRRILLVATVYPYGTPVIPKVTEEHPRNPVTFKEECERIRRTFCWKPMLPERSKAYYCGFLISTGRGGSKLPRRRLQSGGRRRNSEHGRSHRYSARVCLRA